MLHDEQQGCERLGAEGGVVMMRLRRLRREASEVLAGDWTVTRCAVYGRLCGGALRVSIAVSDEAISQSRITIRLTRGSQANGVTFEWDGTEPRLPEALRGLYDAHAAFTNAAPAAVA